MQGTENRTKTLIILILIVIIGVTYSLSIFIAHPAFLNTRLIEPLAEINSLFPLYYVAIALTALLGLGCFIWRIQNRYIHILLLEMFAVMLWLTPNFLAGFVRMPDGPWHVGIAMQLPEVLAGDPVAFSEYASAYPGSYIFNYFFLHTVGIEPAGYIGTFYPLIFTLLFVSLLYLFISRIFNEKVALLSLLITIPGLHYIQVHPSPHTVASLLMIVALLLVIKRGATAKITAIMVIIVIIMSHPITPPLLSAFLAAALLTSIGYYRRFGRAQVALRFGRNQMALASILIFCILGWFAWYLFYPPVPWQERLESLYQLRILSALGVSAEYLAGEPFIYENIHILNRAIYLLYGAAAVAGIVYIGARTYFQKRGIGNWISQLGGLNPGEAFMALSALLLLVTSFMMVGQSPVLVERALTLAILAISCIIASAFVRLYRHRINRRTIQSVAMVGILFLTLSFPIVAYSIDAYSSFPASEEAGLEFVTTDIPFAERTVAMSMEHQLVLYGKSDLNEKEFVRLSSRLTAPDLNRIQPDLIILRNTGYYYAAMRLDLSFDNNRYNEYLSFVNDYKFDKIYSSPTFDVYEK